MKLPVSMLLVLLLTGSFLSAQNNPKIGTEKGVKEKLIRIKAGLPDIKKTLTKKDEMWENEYNVKFEMGNGTVLFKEEDGEQSLKIRYSKSYFSGTATDYQNYYKTLVSLVKEVFGSGYDSSSTNEPKKWAISFYQKGKDVFDSAVRIHISCSWMFESLGPDINIEIYSRLKPPSQKPDEDDNDDDF